MDAFEIFSVFIKWYVSVGMVIYLIWWVKDAVKGFSKFERATKSDLFWAFAACIFVWPFLLWFAEVVE